ncbi:hypothetical protein SUS17_3990 [Sphingomonas sp. S17]|nr:hypothetical protein SUS17_3990 [Sphingomonas sp. S17]
MCSETTKRVLVGKNSCSYSRRSGLRMPGIGYWPAWYNEAWPSR